MTAAPPVGVNPSVWRALTARPIAHRGLWSAGAPENSLAAFGAAAAAGYGIELDVQLSADGVPVVFHDDRLDRLTAAHGRVCERTVAQLAELRLSGTKETIPTLADALECIGRRVLVLVELKVLGGEEGPLEHRVIEALDAYDGPAAVLGFNPNALGRIADARPDILRGLNSLSYHDAANWPLSPEQRRSLIELEHIHAARPHFLSLGLDMIPSPSADALRAQGMPVITWTVRSPDQGRRALAHSDNYMFEGFQA